MRILLTGGTGFLGQAFMRKFAHYSYTVLTRSPFIANKALPTAEYISNLSTLSDNKYFDAIINLAGEPIMNKRWNKKQKRIIYNSRIYTTQQIVDFINHTKAPPKVLLSGSAVGIYGNQGNATLTENNTISETSFTCTLCLNWEKCTQKIKPTTRIALLRTGIVLSPKAGALQKMLPAFRLGFGGKIGQGSQYMSWIDIDDYVQAMHHILTNPKLSGPINMSAPNPVSNAVFTQTLASVLKRPSWCTMPKNVLSLLLGESACLLLDSQRVLPHKLEQHGFSFSFPTLSECLKKIL